jgi:hypothetical protein
MSPFEVLILLWALSAIVAGTVIGRRKGRPLVGFLLGLVIGWIGVLIIAVVPATRTLQLQRGAGQP